MKPSPQPTPALLDDTIAADARTFRRNFLAITAVHVLGLLAFFIAGKMQPKPVVEQVMWLDGGALGGESVAAPEPEPEPIPEPPAPDPTPEPEVLPPPPSEIVEPKATPVPATPKPTTPKPATPKPTTPKPATPKPKPKATPVASVKPKATPSGTPSPKKTPGETAGTTKPAVGPKIAGTDGAAGSGSGAGKTGGGGSGASQFAWYFEMLHDRFYSRWEQPVGIGEDVITAVKLRISKDGIIAAREMVKSSGNPQMDESVMSAAGKVQQIDPLPAGLGNGEFLEINVNFKVDRGQ